MTNISSSLTIITIIINRCFEYGAFKRAPLGPEGLEGCKVSFTPSSPSVLPPDIQSLCLARFAISQTKTFLQSKFPPSTNTPTNAVLQPIRIRSAIRSSHPWSFLQKARSQHRWFSAGIRNFSSKSPSGTRRLHDRSTFPVSKVSKAIVRRGAAPFASTLRPNLTGGALPRSASGYSLGAGRGVRHFSHTPSLQAHVVQNVSAGIRAFLVNGGKARFDGFDEKTGEKRFKTISKTEHEFYQRFKKTFSAPAKGTSLEFHLSPTITALPSAAPNTPLTREIDTITATNLLDNLSVDFARALKDLSATLNELRRLSALGDLPLSLTHGPSGPILTLRFPGCDGASVSRLCDEANVCRGIIREDEAWDHDRDVEMALLFPLAPGDRDTTPGMWREENSYFEHCSPAHATPDQLDWRQMMSPVGPNIRASEDNDDDIVELRLSKLTDPKNTPPTYSESLSGYESLGNASNFAPEDPYPWCSETPVQAAAACSEDYEGLEGIYRFLQECENARR